MEYKVGSLAGVQDLIRKLGKDQEVVITVMDNIKSLREVKGMRRLLKKMIRHNYWCVTNLFKLRALVPIHDAMWHAIVILSDLIRITDPSPVLPAGRRRKNRSANVAAGSRSSFRRHRGDLAAPPVDTLPVAARKLRKAGRALEGMNLEFVRNLGGRVKGAAKEIVKGTMEAAALHGFLKLIQKDLNDGFNQPVNLNDVL